MTSSPVRPWILNNLATVKPSRRDDWPGIVKFGQMKKIMKKEFALNRKLRFSVIRNEIKTLGNLIKMEKLYQNICRDVHPKYNKYETDYPDLIIGL